MVRQIGRVEQAIKQHCTYGDVLPTSGGQSSFKIIAIETDGLKVLAGKSKLPLIPWDTLENVIPYLAGRNSVKVGGVRQSIGAPGTLDDYFKRTVSQTTVANYVAAILEKARVVEYVEEGKARHVRLTPPYMESAL